LINRALERWQSRRAIGCGTLKVGSCSNAVEVRLIDDGVEEEGFEKVEEGEEVDGTE
jgi:hypothetical protein